MRLFYIRCVIVVGLPIAIVWAVIRRICTEMSDAAWFAWMDIVDECAAAKRLWKGNRTEDAA